MLWRPPNNISEMLAWKPPRLDIKGLPSSTDPEEFNELLGIDGFFWTGKKRFQVMNFRCIDEASLDWKKEVWTGKKRFQVMNFHCIDEASLFHLGRRLDNRHLAHAIPAFSEMWMSWAGQPSGIYADPAGEFHADEWLTFLQKQSSKPCLSTEAWQKGRIEKHGQIM